MARNVGVESDGITFEKHMTDVEDFEASTGSIWTWQRILTLSQDRSI
jgi:hypothetical protein